MAGSGDGQARFRDASAAQEQAFHQQFRSITMNAFFCKLGHKFEHPCTIKQFELYCALYIVSTQEVS